MTNYEYYKEKIKAITDLGLTFAVNKDAEEIVLCDELSCGDCLFCPDCDTAKFEWAYKEYIPVINWANIPVDTKVYVRDSLKEECQPAYFAKYENGTIYTWVDGKTSFTTEKIQIWKSVKLAEKVK